MADYNACLPPPPVFGLPEQFDSWRPHQDLAALAAFQTDKQWVAAVAPTGFGKSPMALAVAALVQTAKPGARAAYLTETKGLMSQVGKDFASMGITDIRGQANYECLLIREWERRADGCDAGPCHVGVECDLKANGCTYYDALRKAACAPLLLTNYDYWLNIYRDGKGLGPFDLLILDEAHGAPDKLCGFLATEITERQLDDFGSQMPPRDADLAGWGDWAYANAKVARQRHDGLATLAKSGHRLGHADRAELKMLQQLLLAFETICMAAGNEDNWIVDRSRGNDARFDPIWPSPYLSKLTRQTPKTLLLSATIRPKTLELLGFDPARTQFLEYPSSFPVERRPVVFVPTVQMKYPFTPDKNEAMLRRIDQIVGRRRDRKGIIHTVSYERAKYIVENSAHRDLMMLNDPRTTQTVVARFKASQQPRVLVSPSVGTGFDFPDAMCRYVVIPKVPFPNTTSPVMKARCDRDEEYRNYITMQDIVQMVGRGMRSATDYCETFICDDQWQWLRWKAAKHAPQWFLAACRESNYVPAPLEIAA